MNTETLQKLKTLANTLVDRIETLHQAGVFPAGNPFLVNGIYNSLVNPAEEIRGIIAAAQESTQQDGIHTPGTHSTKSDISRAEISLPVLILQIPPCSEVQMKLQKSCASPNHRG